ncbi:membrane protein insertase YidC [Nonlabens sp. MB-3u-79]|uniref:membrane protein insertase YidC n=1 Tax=Nonlabens sp. MB-3u-79 TaxID=2058134 RepID=UPI000C314337|nr:membrane protein insertase YidC [Nonlabens sp. MB-3u-79]AUC79508.1 membrane protein insertase YidC [Nonlabens sp. MB-3u-79]|tara:strand:+ start:16214 stop:18025 length:1812 start_codon:yes stop_codon:yes gene_type:complete
MEEKKTDWKSMLGLAIIFAIVAFMLFRNQAEKKQVEESTPATEIAAETPSTAVVQNDVPATSVASEGEVIQFNNNLVDFKINTKGALINEALLKSFKTYDSLPVYLVKGGDHKFDLEFMTKDGRKLHTQDLIFTPTSSQNGENEVLSLKADVGNGGSIEFRYELKPDDYMLDFNIRSQGLAQAANTSEEVALTWELQAYRRSKGMDNEGRYTEIKFEYDDGSDDYTGQGETAEEEAENITYIAYKEHFFSSILLTDTPFKSGLLQSYNNYSANDQQEELTKRFTSKVQLEYNGGELAYNMDWYFGPTDYDILAGYKRNLDEVVDLGWGIFGVINEWAVRPLFTYLSSPEKGLGIPYGIAIILLTICVRLVLSPVLYKSYLTQAKMKILRPELNKISEKYKDNAMKKQQETMKVQNEAGASPLSGCLPALLQMPVFFALFKFFPTAFELRQKSFLWADDLSSYDEVFALPFKVPFYGDHVSLFPILASISIFFYMQMTTGQNMQATQQPGMPNMKFIMYLSPLFMLVFFNNYASGLSLYYFVSNLITIGIMLVIKHVIIDKDKVLAKIEKAKAKPKKKKGRFASKMSQIMEQAQAQQEDKKKIK